MRYRFLNRRIERLTDENATLRGAEASRWREISRLRTSMTFALAELGVPGEGYPAPVANAHRILSEALEEHL